MSAWPQILVLIWMALRFIVACRVAGCKIEKTISPMQDLLEAAVISGILYMGGFFAAIGWSAP